MIKTTGGRCELVAESPCWRSDRLYTAYNIDWQLVINHRSPAELTIRPYKVINPSQSFQIFFQAEKYITQRVLYQPIFKYIEIDLDAASSMSRVD